MKQKSAKGIKLRNNIIVHTILAILAVIWMFPVLWVILTSFRGEKGSYISTFFPMILGLFPGFMSMVAVYFILKAVGLTEGNNVRIALILCYSGGAALGFQIIKGFFDTMPKELDEAALIDGCTRWQIFTRITLPLSKPIIIYQILTSFTAPWVDFIFAKVICRANADQYTVAIGLWRMLEKEYIDNWYTSFAAGAVLISIPIAILFLKLQKYYVNGMAGAVKG